MDIFVVPQSARPQAQTTSQVSGLRGGNGCTDGRTDGQMYVGKISSFYRTLSPIGAADLLPKGRSRPIKKSRARVLLTT